MQRLPFFFLGEGNAESCPRFCTAEAGDCGPSLLPHGGWFDFFRLAAGAAVPQLLADVSQLCKAFQSLALVVGVQAWMGRG